MSIAAVKEAGGRADQLQQQIADMASTGELATIFDKWSSVNSNEANSILAMNAAQQRSRLTYGAALPFC